MSFLVYILSTILVSVLMVPVFRLIRMLNVSLKGQKRLLGLVILISMLLPLVMNLTVTTLPAAGGPATVNEYCHCATPHSSDVIIFHAIHSYDLLLENESLFFNIAVLGAVSWLFLLGLRLLRTFRYFAGLKSNPDGILEDPVRENLFAASFGLFRKMIVTGKGFSHLPLAAKRAVLLHENAHLENRDSFSMLLLELTGAIWFLNPAWYFFRKQLVLLQELIADESVIRSGTDKVFYSELLLRIASGQSKYLVSFFGKKMITRRIEFMMKKKNENRPSRKIVVCVAASFLVLFATFSAHFVKKESAGFNAYKYMSVQHDSDGKTSFCKSCVADAVADFH